MLVLLLPIALCKVTQSTPGERPSIEHTDRHVSDKNEASGVAIEDKDEYTSKIIKEAIEQAISVMRPGRPGHDDDDDENSQRLSRNGAFSDVTEAVKEAIEQAISVMRPGRPGHDDDDDENSQVDYAPVIRTVRDATIKVMSNGHKPSQDKVADPSRDSISSIIKSVTTGIERAISCFRPGAGQGYADDDENKAMDLTELKSAVHSGIIEGLTSARSSSSSEKDETNASIQVCEWVDTIYGPVLYCY